MSNDFILFLTIKKFCIQSPFIGYLLCLMYVSCFIYAAGIKALNQTHFSTSSHTSRSGENIAFVTVFTIYNSSLNVNVNDRSSNLVTVGNASYSKVERSMAILNIFINFIQVISL